MSKTFVLIASSAGPVDPEMTEPCTLDDMFPEHEDGDDEYDYNSMGELRIWETYTILSGGGGVELLTYQRMPDGYGLTNAEIALPAQLSFWAEVVGMLPGFKGELSIDMTIDFTNQCEEAIKQWRMQ